MSLLLVSLVTPVFGKSKLNEVPAHREAEKDKTQQTGK